MGKATAKNKLWKAFAEWIRLRDSNEEGFGQCISCNKPIPYPNGTGSWHCGHYYSRGGSNNALYFDERNCNGQCVGCNSFNEGNKQGYARGLIKKYGPDILEALDLKRCMGPIKMYDYEYDEKAKHYRKLVREIKKERGIE